MRLRTLLGAVALVLAAVLPGGCDQRVVPTAPLTGEQCLGYPDEATSPYVLPYPAGESYLLTQGNCTDNSHQGGDKFSYDIDMPIGTLITAIRGGVVLLVEEDFSDTDQGDLGGNFVFIAHDDGTGAEYVHLTRDGALVAVGERVEQGEPVGLSGSSGRAGSPHLHLGLKRCSSTAAGVRCESLPLVFRNASPDAPRGLQPGITYRALPD